MFTQKHFCHKMEARESGILPESGNFRIQLLKHVLILFRPFRNSEGSEITSGTEPCWPEGPDQQSEGSKIHFFIILFCIFLSLCDWNSVAGWQISPCKIVLVLARLSLAAKTLHNGVLDARISQIYILSVQFRGWLKNSSSEKHHNKKVENLFSKESPMHCRKNGVKSVERSFESMILIFD